MLNNLYQKSHNKKIWWVDPDGVKGEHLFTFDKETAYNLFRDYPYKLNDEQIAIFQEEEPFWTDFFKSRMEETKLSFEDTETVKKDIMDGSEENAGQNIGSNVTSIESALDVADYTAKETDKRYTHKEIFGKLRE